MRNRTEKRIAFAEAVTQTLWIRGLITVKERDQIAKEAGDRLRRGKC